MVHLGANGSYSDDPYLWTELPSGPELAADMGGTYEIVGAVTAYEAI